jgi:hypothetical protein
MKHIKTLAIFTLALLCLFSCENQLDQVRLSSESKFAAPILMDMGDVKINADNSKVEAVIFNWREAAFGAETQVEYALHLTNKDKDVLAGTSFTTSLAMSKTDLNGLVCNDLGVAANETAKVGAYLVASVYGTDVATVKSNTINFNVSTFKAALRRYFICGEFQSWTIGEAPVFWETEGGTNIYKTLVDLDNSFNTSRTDDTYSYFKITAEQDWSHDNWGYNYLTPSWSCPEQGDSNLSVPVAEGTINFLTVNVGKMTIDREVVSEVDLIGSFDESNGWGNDVKFAYDPKTGVWSAGPVNFSSGTDFLIRLNASWDGKYKYGDGVKASDSVPGGYELTNSGDAANINVPSNGTYVMKLYADRTPFVLVMEKQ